jgi:ADP-ribosylglycohydrolase
MNPTERAQLALEGLSIGDAFGGRELPYSGLGLRRRSMPPAPWPWSDETALASALVAHLAARGKVDQDELAATWARVYAYETARGYSLDSIRLFPRIYGGVHWTYASRDLLGGKGSASNAAAGRVAPLGAFFADDVSRVVTEARAMAEITHCTADGQDGAVAMALAAAAAWNERNKPLDEARRGLLLAAHAHTPDGRVREGLRKALEVPWDTALPQATEILGNGAHDSAADTVPFAIWMAGRHLHDFVEAMWTTADAYGDMNTNCALVASLIGLRLGWDGIPADWSRAREPLPAIEALSS